MSDDYKRAIKDVLDFLDQRIERLAPSPCERSVRMQEVIRMKREIERRFLK